MQTKSTQRIKKFMPWMVWLLAASFFFYKNMLMVSPSVMSSALMTEFAITAAGFGNLAACYFYAYTLMQVPVGILLDRYSIRHIVTGAILLCAMASFMFGNAHSLYTAEIARALIGLGAAFAPVACFKLIAAWFPARRFAFLAGLSLAMGMIGGVAGNAPVALLVNSQGWRSSMVILAIPALVLAALFWAVVRIPETPTAADPQHDKKSGLFDGLLVILKDKQTWLLSFYSGLAYAPVTIFGGVWGSSYLAAAYHLPSSVAAMNASLVFVGFAIGGPLAGWLSDLMGRRKPMIAIGTLISLITISLVMYVPELPVLVVSILLLSFGIGIGSYLLCFSMLREIHAMTAVGTAIGFMNTFDSLWEALTQPLVGKMLDLGWDGVLIDGVRVFSPDVYRWSLSVLPLYLAIALGLLFFIKETYCRQGTTSLPSK